MKRRTVLSILLMVCARLGFPLKTSASPSLVQDANKQPDNWVPITWVQELTNPTNPNGLHITARQYRRADGSLRSESGPSFAFVSILNLSERRFYIGKPGKNWQQHPMRPQPNRLKLPADAVPVASNDPRVIVVSIAFPTASFFEVVSKNGSTTIYCPDLDLLHVWLKQPNGQQLEITSISAGVSDEISFRPPTGASIDIRTNPEGLGVGNKLPERHIRHGHV